MSKEFVPYEFLCPKHTFTKHVNQSGYDIYINMYLYRYLYIFICVYTYTYIYTTFFNIRILGTLHTDCRCGFRVIFRVNGDYVPKQDYLVGCPGFRD